MWETWLHSQSWKYFILFRIQFWYWLIRVLGYFKFLHLWKTDTEQKYSRKQFIKRDQESICLRAGGKGLEAGWSKESLTSWCWSHCVKCLGLSCYLGVGSWLLHELFHAFSITMSFYNQRHMLLVWSASSIDSQGSGFSVTIRSPGLLSDTLSALCLHHWHWLVLAALEWGGVIAILAFSPVCLIWDLLGLHPLPYYLVSHLIPNISAFPFIWNFSQTFFSFFAAWCRAYDFSENTLLCV